jgi:hypothetical protein
LQQPAGRFCVLVVQVVLKTVVLGAWHRKSGCAFCLLVATRSVQMWQHV